MIPFRRATLLYKAARRSYCKRIGALSALFVSALLCGLAFSSCGRPAGDPPAALAAAEGQGWPLQNGRLALALASDGTLAPVQGAEYFNEPRPEPRPYATQEALAAIAVQGRRLVLALNRIGLQSLTLRSEPEGKNGAAGQAGGARVFIDALGSPAGLFLSRSVGKFWPFGATLRLFLYRPPYFETEPKTDTSHIFLELASESAEEATEQASSLQHAQIGGADIYAIYPLGQGKLLYQTREERGERVLSAYGRFDERAGTAQAMGKQAFEAALQPLPLSAAPKELRTLADLVPGDIVIELTRADASTQSYSRGSLAESTQAWARLSAGGAILAAADGRGAYLPAAGGASGQPRAFNLSVELGWPGMRFRDPCLFDGLAAFIWEEELFPLLGRSGLLLVDCTELGL